KPIFPKIIKPDINILEEVPEGTKQILDKHGPECLSKWLKEQPNTLLTDTTFRDAHQSLLATRVRTHDLVGIADETARLLPALFSMEMWGGATVDVYYSFLREDSCERLCQLRNKITNVLFQMLIR